MAGVDALALRQHLLLNGSAATAERLLSPSTDTDFPQLRSAPSPVRKDCADVIGMPMRDDPSGATEAGNRVIEEVPVGVRPRLPDFGI